MLQAHDAASSLARRSIRAYTRSVLLGGILGRKLTFRGMFLSGCVFAVSVFWCPGVGAQTEQSKAEAGAQFSVLTMNRFASTPAEPGIGGRFSWNLMPSLAVDTEFNFYPEDYTPQSVQDGGRVFSFFAGVKVAAIRREKFAVFGKIRPGLVTFGNVPVQTSAVNVENERLTHFATDLGGVFEYYISPRWILRTDLGVTLIKIDSRTVSLGTNGSITAPGTMRPAFQFSTGVSYRIGELQTREAEGSEGTFDIDKKWEVAGQVVTQTRERTDPQDVVTQPGIGGRVTYDLFPHLSLEGALTFFVRSEGNISGLEGGRSIQTFVGVKAGVHHEKLGYFLRLRPGFQTFTQTISSIDANTLAVQTASKTHPALDLGGGIEFYPSKRTVVRFDAGDTLLFFGSNSYPFGTQLITEDGGTKNTLQFGASFGWRF